MVMPRDEKGPPPDLVDSVAVGFITKERAEEIAAEYPGMTTAIVGWIRQLGAAQDWRKVGTLVNLAAQLPVPGLGQLLIELLDANIAQLNNEDIVEILGELREAAAAGSLFSAVERSTESDSPAYWLCQKAIESLSDLETGPADEYLRMMTTASWPDPIRWYAAVALGIEDELGFAEDQMVS